MVLEGQLPYWHFEHEVLLAEAKANISDGAMEEAGGSENQNQVKVTGKGRLEKGKADLSLGTCVRLQKQNRNRIILSGLCIVLPHVSK